MFSPNQASAQISLTAKGIEFIQLHLSAEEMQFLEDSGHVT